ncbi:DUF3885 domain-containing protein [Streptosporangium canum]|uniref:DUF3885 domain-containing protein n=1 Tax=Streptosporangium canum TaxID=324952 RepID=UPI003F4E2C86
MASPTTSPVAGSCDGGADVILSTRAERDGLKARHHTWLSDHPAGLSMAHCRPSTASAHLSATARCLEPSVQAVPAPLPARGPSR